MPIRPVQREEDARPGELESHAWVSRPEDRASVLADVTLELTTTLDVEQAVERLARLIVPRLGDWCIVSLQDADGGLRDVGSWHADPERRELVTRYAQLRMESLTEGSFVWRSLREGATQAVRQRATERIASVLHPGPGRDLLLQLRPASLAVVPMSTRGRTVGILSVYRDDGAPRLDDDTLGRIAEVAARAALVVDNAMTFKEAVLAREQAEAAGLRLALLAQVTEALSSTLDAREAVGRTARLLVPQLADWCVVSVVDSEGRLDDLGFAHVDRARTNEVAAYCAARSRDPDPASALATVVRTGIPVVVPDAAGHAGWPWLWSSRLGPGVAEIVEGLEPGALVILPVALRGRVLGTLTLVTGRGRGPLTDEELLDATEVARRAATALENIRLYRNQRRLAEELQRSLLTAPPQPGNVEIVVRYVPAAHEAQVGGDWYDAFVQPGGAVTVAIGDVVGHDTRAAAAMGQVRTLLRGIAYTTDASPAAVLTRLDEALEGLELDTTATVVLARLEPVSDAADEGRRVLHWSNAGHPPPVYQPPHGPVQTLEVPRGGSGDGPGAESDLLLGIDARTRRCDHAVELAPGSLVLLYTDGLVERRGVSLDDGIERLRAAVTEAGGRPLDKLCDDVLAELLPRVIEDDVALVALRVRPTTGSG